MKKFIPAAIICVLASLCLAVTPVAGDTAVHAEKGAIIFPQTDMSEPEQDSTTATAETAGAPETAGTAAVETAEAKPVEKDAAVLPALQRSLPEKDAGRGNYGRIYIDAAGVDVAVFYTKDLYTLQNLVDAADSAAMFDWYDGNQMIADHNYQGFSAIGKCAPGTCAELVTRDGNKYYSCEEVIYNGWNAGTSLTYPDHTPIGSRYTGRLVMYTCSAGGTVNITVWKQLEKVTVSAYAMPDVA